MIALTILVINTVLLGLVARAVLSPVAPPAASSLPGLPFALTALLPYLGAVLVFAVVSWLLGWRAEQRNRADERARERVVARAREQYPELAEQLGQVSARAVAMWQSHGTRGPATQ
jgi:hypothetical protein